MDVAPDGDVRFGFPSISGNVEIVEMMVSGAHMALFVTGRRSGVGPALGPVVTIAANPDLRDRLHEDMDVNARRIMTGAASIASFGAGFHDLVVGIPGGTETKSEALGHQEFFLTYKSFEPIGPACLPA